MKVEVSHSKTGFWLSGLALIMGLAVSSAHAVSPPPPPDPPPAPVLTEIAISGPTGIDEKTSAQYICMANYSDGTSVDVDAFWSDDSPDATIDNSGVLTVSDVNAAQEITLTVSYGGKSDTLLVVVADIPVLLTGVEISGPASLDEGSSAQYTCTASYSDGATAQVAPNWSEDSTNADIDGNGVLSAGDVAADESMMVTASYGGFTDTYDVSIRFIPVVIIGIEISGPASVDEETTAQYTCTATYSDGSTATVGPSWSDNSAYASLNDSGLLTANDVTSDQNVTITASFDGQTDTHAVTIAYVPPVLTGIAISGPASMNEESTIQYTCTASYSDGTSAVVTPNWSENSAYTTISGTGLLSAGNVAADQSVTITATFGGQTDTHAVTIKYVAPVLTSIAISGPSSVTEQTTAQYICTASYSDGTSAVVAPSWSENSAYATINASGLLSAGDVTASQNVTVTASYDGKSDTLEVLIAYVPPVVTSITISGPGSIEEGTTAQYVCTAHYADAPSAQVDAVWSIVDSTFAAINEGGLISVGNITSDEQVTVRASFGGQEAMYTLSIMAIGNQVVFPLSGFDGKTVYAVLWDSVVQSNIVEEFSFEPEEFVIENVNSNQWYWLGLSEYDEGAETTNQVYGQWIWM